ncbi:hypothetical protein CGRA01v4_10687 [Colletotrichum graminicola]|nr:hypothetical protein CGRA01v4_10687 [Colletotrichum graminicola]
MEAAIQFLFTFPASLQFGAVVLLQLRSDGSTNPNMEVWKTCQLIDYGCQQALGYAPHKPAEPWLNSPSDDDDDDDDDDEEWPSDVRRDACIVVEEPALASLVRAPDFVPGKIPDLDLEPWVVVIDGKDPAGVPYHGGGPYMGFTRSYARVLGQLFENLGSRSLARLSPIREYDGQIPLYDGSSQGKLVDPAGGAEGRFKFSRGTPRG